VGGVKKIATVAIAAAAVGWALWSPAFVQAVGGRYVFDGGTPRERREVGRALDVSGFDWSVVAAPVVIHIEPGVESRAIRGHVWLDADLLDAGTFAWGVVQHEYAHQVDFFLFDDADRELLLTKLGGKVWCSESADLRHAELGCERFASTLAWAYWPSTKNCMRPDAPDDESAALPPAQFRALIFELIRERTLPEHRRPSTAEDGR
jgi:hypothetical protein